MRLSLLALALFCYPFGIQALIGVMRDSICSTLGRQIRRDTHVTASLA
jgi:hypothetical protein